jgi:L-lactate dehydrogenase complex protein LldG
MSEAREEILARVRAALADVPAAERPEDVAVARDYRRAGDRSPGQLIERLEDRLRDYGATVRHATADTVDAVLTEACRELNLRRVVAPRAAAARWRPAGIELIEDDGLSPHELDQLDGVITGCAAAIAETGTLILDGDGDGVCGRRAITLVPDHHICVVGADQVVELVPEGIARVGLSVTERGLPITLISGPSATSDIELSRVDGVHGPRHLVVVMVGEPSGRGA